MVRPEAQILREYLIALRRVARRRQSLVTVVGGFTLLGAWAALLLALTGWSGRGDLGASLGLGLSASSLAALVIVSFRRARRSLGSFSSIARSVAGARGPLREVSSAHEREQDSILRHEILGATELWRELEAGDCRSPELAAAYVRRIGAATVELDPKLALPRPRWAPRLVLLASSLALCVGMGTSSLGQRGLELLLTRADGRPPPPPQPVWNSLVLVLDYPAHTRRPPRRVPNPSTGLRLPAGTRVSLELDAASDADAVRLVMTHDRLELANAPAPTLIDLSPIAPPEARRWTGEFEVRAAGSWVIALLEDGDDPSAAAISVATRRSDPLRVELELDGPPEVELLPLPASQREANETDRVDLRFAARDDFGVTQAELVYEFLTPEGELERHRLPAGEAPGGSARTWRHRYTWDLSAIPIEQRGAVSYWIEVRDNDPGLGLAPLVGGPGKVTASARQQLLLHDDEAEHAANTRDLQAIRDAAVDLLAARLTTRAFAVQDDPLFYVRAIRRARELHQGSAALLALLAAAVDALAVDTMIETRDVEALAAIHARLLELHRSESALHEQLPVNAELERLDSLPALLRQLGAHNGQEVTALEDEIIRLDDLVDTQIIAHIETLVSRLQVSQQKLVEKLEQLAAGDESVRPEVEQLEQRIREDLQRIQQAKNQLRKEVGEEWMNLDAFKAMEARMRSQELLEQLRRGDVDGALEQAREQLDEIRSLRQQVQRSGSEAQTPGLSEEDRQRMTMLRELSRLQDDETGLRSETTRLREAWRDAVAEIEAKPGDAEHAKREAQRMREALDEVDDSNLSRDGRNAWEDAREAYEQLEAAAEAGESRQVELLEAAQAAAGALERASAGAKPGEAEAKALRELSRKAQSLEARYGGGLPPAREILDAAQTERIEELSQAQRSLRERTQKLLEDPAASVLPEPGRDAMKRAGQSMRDAKDSLQDASLDQALDSTRGAWNGLQQAIDSLRQGSPPPPPAGGGEASTEAERDRSLRDQVVEAMREGDRDDFASDTERYYEELLR